MALLVAGSKIEFLEKMLLIAFDPYYPLLICYLSK